MDRKRRRGLLSLLILSAMVFLFCARPVSAETGIQTRENDDVSATGLEIRVNEITTDAAIYRAGGGTIRVVRSDDGTSLLVTLDNAVIGTGSNKGLSFDSFASTDITSVDITLIGSSHITAAGDGVYIGQGKLHNGTDVTISGGGTLDITSTGTYGSGIFIGGGGYDDVGTLNFQSGTVNINGGCDGILSYGSRVSVQGTAEVNISGPSDEGILLFWVDQNYSPTCGVSVRENGKLNVTDTTYGVFSYCTGTDSHGGFVEVSEEGSLYIEAEGAGMYANELTVSGNAKVTVSVLHEDAVTGILVAGQVTDRDAVNISGGRVTVNSVTNGIWAKNGSINIGGTSAVNVIVQGEAQGLHVGGQAEMKVGETVSVAVLAADESAQISSDGSIKLAEDAVVTVTGIQGNTKTTATVKAPKADSIVKMNEQNKLVVPGGASVYSGGEEIVVPDDGGTLNPVNGEVRGTVYTIIFHANGGSVAETAAETVDGRLSVLPVPTRGDGYRFDGWYTEADGGEIITADTVFTSDTTIYAHWTYTGDSGKEEARTYTITFHANGGSVAETAAETVDGRLSVLPVPTRGDGYRFDGWYTEADGGEIITTDTVFTSDTTIYAHWTYAGASSESGTGNGGNMNGGNMNGGNADSGNNVTGDSGAAKPAEGQNAGPKTGDDSPLGLYAALALTGGSTCVCVYFMYRKKRKQRV